MSSCRRSRTRFERRSTPSSAGRASCGRGDDRSDAARPRVHVIERNATAQARMIDDMLDMARSPRENSGSRYSPSMSSRWFWQPIDVVMPAAHAKRHRLCARTSIQGRRVSRRSGSAAAGDLESAVERPEVHRGGWLGRSPMALKAGSFGSSSAIPVRGSVPSSCHTCSSGSGRPMPRAHGATVVSVSGWPSCTT